MSSGGGGSGGSTTTTTDLPAWAQPYAQQLLQRGADLSNQAVPQYTGQTVAGQNATQTAGISGAAAAAAGQAGNASTANGIAQALAGGNAPTTANPYAGNVSASTAADSFADPANNPYLAQTAAAANKQLTDAYSNTVAPSTLAQFRNSGAFGGSAQQQQTTANQQQLEQGLSDQTNALYGNAYNTAAGVASNNAAQQNQVAEANQSTGTQANEAENSQNSANYFNYLGAQQGAVNGATGANTAASATAGNEISAGGTQQGNDQDALNAAYQQWYNSVNAPYGQLSTLSGALSGALGSGTGTSVSSSNPGSGSGIGNVLGLAQAGAGAYGASQSK